VLKAGTLRLLFILSRGLRVEEAFLRRVVAQGTSALTVTALNRTALEVSMVATGSQYLATAGVVEIPLEVLAGVCVWGRRTVRVNVVLVATTLAAMQTAQSVAAVAGPLSAVSASPASAVAVTRLNILLSLLECDPLDFDRANGNNMLSILIGPERGASTRGAVVGNVAIVAMFSAVLCCVMLAFAAYGRYAYGAPLRASLSELQSVFHFPGILLLPVAAVCQPTVAACVQLIALAPLEGDRLFGILGLAVMVLVLMLPFTLAICQQFCLVLVDRSEYQKLRNARDGAKSVDLNGDGVDEGNDGGQTAARSALDVAKGYAHVLFQERATWQPIAASDPNCVAWKKRFVPVYMDCGTWWYPLVDMWMAATVGVVGGLTIGVSSVCYAQLAVVALTYAATATLQLFIAVPLVLSSKCYAVALQLLGFASCGALVVEFLATGKTPAATVATWCVLGITVLSTAKSALDFIFIAIAMPKRFVRAARVIKTIPPATMPPTQESLPAAKSSEQDGSNIVVDFEIDSIESVNLEDVALAETNFALLEQRAAEAAAQQEAERHLIDAGGKPMIDGDAAEGDDLLRCYTGTLIHRINSTALDNDEASAVIEWDNLLRNFEENTTVPADDRGAHVTDIAATSSIGQLSSVHEGMASGGAEVHTVPPMHLFESSEDDDPLAIVIASAPALEENASAGGNPVPSEILPPLRRLSFFIMDDDTSEDTVNDLSMNYNREP
jgi:hypothetical protein